MNVYNYYSGYNIFHFFSILEWSMAIFKVLQLSLTWTERHNEVSLPHLDCGFFCQMFYLEEQSKPSIA